LNIATLLKTIQILIHNPNPDDGLVLEITDQYRRDLSGFQQTAREWTRKYATTATNTTTTQAVTNTTATTTTAPYSSTATMTDSTTTLTAATTRTTTTQTTDTSNPAAVTVTTSNECVLGVRSSAFADDNSDDEGDLIRRQQTKKAKLN
jgi:hypothetical protein